MSAAEPFLLWLFCCLELVRFDGQLACVDHAA